MAKDVAVPFTVQLGLLFTTRPAGGPTLLNRSGSFNWLWMECLELPEAGAVRRLSMPHRLSEDSGRLNPDAKNPLCWVDRAVPSVLFESFQCIFEWMQPCAKKHGDLERPFEASKAPGVLYKGPILLHDSSRYNLNT
jgi:hypothetical protein